MVEYDRVDDDVVILTRNSLPRVFIWLTNFYQHFIWKGKIAAPVTSMFKTSESTESTTRPGKNRVRVDGGSRSKSCQRLKNRQRVQKASKV